MPSENVRLRPLGFPSRMQVRSDREGSPIEIGQPGQRVLSIRETWRIDDEWWRQPISRLYYVVVLENGRMVTLYRDLIDRSWHTQ